MTIKKKPCEFCHEFTSGIFHSHIVCKKCKIKFKRLRNIEQNDN